MATELEKLHSNTMEELMKLVPKMMENYPIFEITIKKDGFIMTASLNEKKEILWI